MTENSPEFLVGRLEGKVDSILLLLQRQEKRADDHEDRIGDLETFRTRSETERKTIRWLVAGAWTFLIAIAGIATTALPR